MPCSIVVGGQWGDEGKGKIASYLAIKDRVSIAVRAGLGPGAGHTVRYEGREYRFRQIPSAAVNTSIRLLIGAGTLISPEVLLNEIAAYNLQERIGIDYRATIIEPGQIERDKTDAHLATVVKSTGSGHGPALADRAMRIARQAQDAKELQPYLTDVSAEINEACDRNERVQIEGTNGFLLSVLYGTYPHTVAKDSTASTVAADVGVGPLRIDEVILCFKSFPTRVGGGVFPTEMDESEASHRGFIEYGTVTGRRRRVGSFDFSLARKAVEVNHPSALALTFMDRIDPSCLHQSSGQLSDAVKEFVEKVEAETRAPVRLLGTGADTFDVIDRK